MESFRGTTQSTQAHAMGQPDPSDAEPPLLMTEKLQTVTLVPTPKMSLGVASSREEFHVIEDSTMVKIESKACKAEEFEYVAAFPFCPGCCGDWKVLAAAHDEEGEEGREREEEREEEEKLREWMMFWCGF